MVGSTKSGVDGGEKYLGRVVVHNMDERKPEDLEALRLAWEENKARMEPEIGLEMSEEVNRPSRKCQGWGVQILSCMLSEQGVIQLWRGSRQEWMAIQPGRTNFEGHGSCM